MQMLIGERLKSLREERNLSQGHIEKRTGLLRCYISRVENGHTIPSIETLEKISRAMEVNLPDLFHNGPVGKFTSQPVHAPNGTKNKMTRLLVPKFEKLEKTDQQLVCAMVRFMGRHHA